MRQRISTSLKLTNAFFNKVKKYTKQTIKSKRMIEKEKTPKKTPLETLKEFSSEKPLATGKAKKFKLTDITSSDLEHPTQLQGFAELLWMNKYPDVISFPKTIFEDFQSLEKMKQYNYHFVMFEGNRGLIRKN